MTIPLNRNSWEPLYYQIADQIRTRVENDLPPGARIPSENELIAKYNVSRNTVRLAIETLIKQGLVYRVKGRGTFVNQARLRYGLFHLVSFSEETRRRGMRPSSRMLRLSRIIPPVKIHEALSLEPEQEVFAIERLRLANEQPMALNVSYIPCHLCPDLDRHDLIHDSMYRAIEEIYHLNIAYAQQTLKPVIASEAEARLLEVPPGSPMQLVEGVSYLMDGIPIEYAKLVYRGDRYEFPIQAIRQDETGMKIEQAHENARG